jgi:hypothetical protein
MLLMYNRTYTAEIGMFLRVDFCVDYSVCCGCKEAFGDRGEGKEAWCFGYKWQCAVDKGRVDILDGDTNIQCSIWSLRSDYYLPSYATNQLQAIVLMLAPDYILSAVTPIRFP